MRASQHRIASWPSLVMPLAGAAFASLLLTAPSSLLEARGRPGARAPASLAALAPPLPVRNPQRGTAGPQARVRQEPPQPMWSEDDISAARARCKQMLAAVAVELEPQPAVSAAPCGTAAPVLVKRIGRDPVIEVSPPATLTCPMVVALSQWIEATLQPTARRQLGAPIVKIANAASYSCRFRNNARQGKLSEHAFANALDIRAFVTDRGDAIEVADHWPLQAPNPPEAREAETPAPARSAGGNKVATLGPVTVPAHAASQTATRSPTDPPAASVEPSAEATFLRAVHAEACGVFKTVLGPDADAAHRDHFHLDLAVRKRGATFCQ